MIEEKRIVQLMMTYKERVQFLMVDKDFARRYVRYFLHPTKNLVFRFDNVFSSHL
jgi:hypothetical protein